MALLEDYRSREEPKLFLLEKEKTHYSFSWVQSIIILTKSQQI